MRTQVLGQSLIALAGISLLTYFSFVLGINLMTVSSVYLLAVVAMASFCGFWQASFTSLLAVACLDYFFMPPLFRFNINDHQDWVALLTFEVNALVISRLSVRELRSATDAAFHRAWLSQLYELSRSSLCMDLHQPPGPQLVVLIKRIFDARAVALFDRNLDRQDSAGEWGKDEQNLCRRFDLLEAGEDDPGSETSTRVLHVSSGSVGVLAVRGNLSPLVVDALAALAAIAIDRHQSFANEEKADAAKKGEQLRAAVMDALGHEFKTPLTTVQTASSGLLELGGLTAMQYDLAKLIEIETVRMSAMCSKLLTTAKLDAGQVGLNVTEINMRELISEVLSGSSSEERARIEVSMEDAGLTVWADRALLEAILVQYTDNARKYSAPGTRIKIKVEVSHSEMMVSVHNFGPTISIGDRELIFDRFYRAENLTQSVAGTGIGLSVARKAAEAHHGHVWVVSDEKDGTTFFLSLPMDSRRKH